MAMIRPAAWPHDIAVAQTLLRHYLQFLQNNPAGPVDVCLAGYDAELANLHTVYVEPASVLLLAFEDDTPLGCVAVKQRPDRPATCEMKRLWTEPAARGSGLGHRLIEAAMHWSRAAGANMLLLDTVAAAMPEAVRLYRSLGFEETTRHNSNPVAGLLFMQVAL